MKLIFLATAGTKLSGACCTKGVIYKSEVEHENGTNRFYLGCTEGTVKYQWYNHKFSCSLQSQPRMGFEEKIIEAQTRSGEY